MLANTDLDGDRLGDKNDSRISDEEWSNFIAKHYSKTAPAHANPQSHQRSYTGAWGIPSEVASSRHRDTACPLTPKERLEKDLKVRWPDAVGIGFPKCGTSSLGFVDCHSKLVFREAEPYYWNNQGSIEIIT